MVEVVDDVVEVSVFQAQFVQLLAQDLNFFVCQLLINSRGSCQQSLRLIARCA